MNNNKTTRKIISLMIINRIESGRKQLLESVLKELGIPLRGGSDYDQSVRREAKAMVSDIRGTMQLLVASRNGHKATGDKKRRSPEHYRRMVAARWHR